MAVIEGNRVLFRYTLPAGAARGAYPCRRRAVSKTPTAARRNKQKETDWRNRCSAVNCLFRDLDFLLALKDEDCLLSHGASLVISSMGSCC